MIGQNLKNPNYPIVLSTLENKFPGISQEYQKHL
jgi:hypothetical protein